MGDDELQQRLDTIRETIIMALGGAESLLESYGRDGSILKAAIKFFSQTDVTNPMTTVALTQINCFLNDIQKEATSGP